MKVIVGLGNPGVQYQGTRHNAGMMLVDQLASLPINQSSYGWREHYDSLIYNTPDLVLVKTKDIFMNESGRIIYELRTMNYELSNLYVAHDDLDIRLGEYKIQRGIGPKVHYGLQSVEGTLGTKDFWRIRIGIDNRATPMEGETYVLQKFSPEEKVILENTLDAIIKAIDSDQKSSRQE